MADPDDFSGPDIPADGPSSPHDTPLPGETQAARPRPTEEEPTRLYTSAPFFFTALGSGLTPHERLGKYEVQEPLGRGGMGIVWKAFDPGLHRAVAIKVLGEQLMQSPTARRRFLREARAAAAVSHPHVLTIHSVEEQDGIPFLVMEYVSGQSLKDYVADNGSLDSLEVIRLGGQIAQGLAAAHAQGVIHRDVKPANVMLDEGATCAQLTDFGLARVAFDNIDLTSQDQNVGTPAYMSPESLRGNKIDARSDLFSLGCVLYQMLTGNSPFYGRSQGEIIHKILESQPRRLHEIHPAIPEVLSEIVHQLLQKSPDDRIQSAAEVADVLTRLLHQVNQAPTDEIPNILAKAAAAGPVSDKHPSARWLLPAIACVMGLVAVVMILSRNSPSTDGQQADAAVVGDLDAAEAQGNGPPIVEKFDQLLIGSGPDAQYKTIAEGLRHANPGATVTVVGPGPFFDAVTIKGRELDGVQLVASPRAVWHSPESGSIRALEIVDVSDVVIRGFDFEVDQESGRAVRVEGDARDILIEDCTFQHALAGHGLALLQVATAPEDDSSAVRIRDCRFEAFGEAGKCLALGEGESAARVDCSGCRFQASNVLVYINDGCREVTLSHNIFRGSTDDSIGLNVDYRRWFPDTTLEVSNNTFADVRYWFSLMDSFRSGSLPTREGTSRVCNNLILGGHRVLGGDDQWDPALGAWTFASNWWERDATTQSDAGRGGRIATIRSGLQIAERTDADHPRFLQPDEDSPLLTSGVDGDLPKYIGARGPRPAVE